MTTSDSIDAANIQTPEANSGSDVLLSNSTIESDSALIKPDISNNELLWNKYLLLLVIANLICLFFKGYPADLGYWTDWVKQLNHQGYQHFNGNYPPIYVHWLWCISKFYWLTGMPIEANLLLKFLTQLPVLFTHIAITRLVFNYLTKNQTSNLHFHFILTLTALNPAILLNGPIWGQVDLIPISFACLAIIFSCSQTKVYWMIPCFTLALLTKFQMIALAPLFGFLFFRQIKQQILGILISLGLIALAFLPYLITGNFVSAFKQSYIDTLAQYPLTTFNAANIWILITGNSSPDTRILFGDHQGILKTIFRAKYFGILVFSCVAITIFVTGLMHQKRLTTKLMNNSYSSAADTYYLKKHLEFSFFIATLCLLVFFFLLPAMHERYMFPAVVVALVYCSMSQTKLFIPITISLLCSLNMLIIVELNGSDIWHGLAWGLTGLVTLLILDMLFSGRASLIFGKLSLFLLNKKYFSVYFLAILVPLLTAIFVEHYKINSLTLSKNQIFIGDLPRNYAIQDHGSLNINRSFDGNVLSIGDQRFMKGLGTHANSDIQFVMPENVKTFRFTPGLDDEVGSAEVTFSVWADNNQIWNSSSFYGTESAKEIILNIEKVHLLNLKVNSKGDDRWDHADWINPVIELEHKE